MIRYDTLPVHGSRTVFLCRLNIQIEPVEYRTESLQVLPKTTSDISAQLLKINAQYRVKVAFGLDD